MEMSPESQQTVKQVEHAMKKMAVEKVTLKDLIKMLEKENKA